MFRVFRGAHFRSFVKTDQLHINFKSFLDIWMGFSRVTRSTSPLYVLQTAASGNCQLSNCLFRMCDSVRSLITPGALASTRMSARDRKIFHSEYRRQVSLYSVGEVKIWQCVPQFIWLECSFLIFWRHYWRTMRIQDNSSEKGPVKPIWRVK